MPVLTALLMGVLAATAQAQQPPATAAPATAAPATTAPAPAPASPPTDEQLIASALSAAPPSVGRDATVMVIEADGTTRVLRDGTNGFTCLPDNPATPGPDPMCADRNAMEWTRAWLENRDPPADKVGIIYMLAGNSDASSTDPQATEPAPGGNWIETGPLVMIVGVPKMTDSYPKTSPPDTKAPYAIWVGTPFEHVVIPVK
jgi:hypothetical protein